MKDYSEVYLEIKSKLKNYHDLTLKGKFEEATDVAIELADLTIQLEALTISKVQSSISEYVSQFQTS